MKKIKLFIQESVAELKRVVWPTREKVIDNTKLVLISTAVMGLFFGAIDFLLVQATLFIF